MIQLFYKFVDQGISWLFRPRSLGLQLLKYGSLILATTLGADLVFGAEYKGEGSSFNVHVATSGGLPALAINGAYLIGAALIFLGVGLLIRQVALDVKKERRQLLIVVELRGLHGSPGTPAKNSIMRDFLGHRQSIVIDFRPRRAADLVDRNLMLQKLTGLTSTIEALTAGRDSADVFLAVGGLAAVPALFFTGVLLEDDSNITVFDWDRSKEVWKVPDGPDDGKRFAASDASGTLTSTPEVVLAVSCSYDIRQDDIVKAFPGLPVVRLDAQEELADRFWSKEKQSAFVVEFRDAVQHILNSGAKSIHLLLAAPSSLAIQMGRAYDSRLHPNLIVYQYERSLHPVYPWGLQMPTNGQHNPSIVENIHDSI